MSSTQKRSLRQKAKTPRKALAPSPKPLPPNGLPSKRRKYENKSLMGHSDIRPKKTRRNPRSAPSNPHNAGSNTSSRLLALPRELRDMILEYLLLGKRRVIRAHAHVPETYNDQCGIKTRYQVDQIYLPNILLVNRQIHDEMIDVVGRNLKLQVELKPIPNAIPNKTRMRTRSRRLPNPHIMSITRRCLFVANLDELWVHLFKTYSKSSDLPLEALLADLLEETIHWVYEAVEDVLAQTPKLRALSIELLCSPMLLDRFAGISRSRKNVDKSRTVSTHENLRRTFPQLHRFLIVSSDDWKLLGGWQADREEALTEGTATPEYFHIPPE